MEKNPPMGYLLNTYELLEKVNASNSPSPLHLLDDPQKRDCDGASGATTDGDPNIYFLIQKMFCMLNTLTSNMSSCTAR